MLNRRVAVFVGSMGLLATGVVFGIVLKYCHIPGQVRSILFPPQPEPTNPPLTHGVLVGDDTIERTEVPIGSLKSTRIMVALAFGQSNSANHGDTRHDSGGNVFNFYLGKLYKARDPLLGATGDGGSVWTRLGDLVVNSNMWDAVVIAPIGVGSSEIQRWSPGGDLHPVLIYTLRDLRNHGIPATHLFWHQGEADEMTSIDQYKNRFHRMLNSIRQEKTDAPIFVSIASRLRKGVSVKVQQAQSELIDPARRIYLGPNTDTLGNDWRNSVDQTHFSEKGLQKFAEMWLAAIRQSDDR